MKVEIQTRIESSKKIPAVYIHAAETMYCVESVEERIRALQTAADWLRKELARS